MCALDPAVARVGHVHAVLVDQLPHHVRRAARGIDEGRAALGPEDGLEFVGIELQAGDHLAAVAARAAEARLLCLEHHGLDAAFRQMQRCRQAAIAAADDTDIGRDRLRQERAWPVRLAPLPPTAKVQEEKARPSRLDPQARNVPPDFHRHSYQGMWSAILSATAPSARCMRFGIRHANTEVTAMSNQRHRVAVALAALLVAAAPLAARAEPIKNVVLVHGAWVDGSGWRASARHPGQQGLARDRGPGTRDLVRGRRERDPAHPRPAGRPDPAGRPASYGGSIVTEAGIHPKVVGLVYVAAHAPDAGEDEGALGKRTPSGLGQDPGSHRPDAGRLHLPGTPSAFPTLFAPDLPRHQAEFEASSQVPAAAEVFTTPLSRRRVAHQAELGNRRRQ